MLTGNVVPDSTGFFDS